MTIKGTHTSKNIPIKRRLPRTLAGAAGRAAAEGGVRNEAHTGMPVRSDCTS